MMIEQAKVLRYQNGRALVQCFAKSGCGGCAEQSACGTKALSALAGEKFAPQFEIAVNEPLAAGDHIELGLAERRLLASVFWLYGLPLLAVIASSLLFSQWIENELIVASGVLGCTLAMFLGVKMWLLRKVQNQFEPIFIRKI